MIIPGPRAVVEALLILALGIALTLLAGQLAIDLAWALHHVPPGVS